MPVAAAIKDCSDLETSVPIAPKNPCPPLEVTASAHACGSLNSDTLIPIVLLSQELNPSLISSPTPSGIALTNLQIPVMIPVIKDTIAFTSVL